MRTPFYKSIGGIATRMVTVQAKIDSNNAVCTLLLVNLQFLVDLLVNLPLSVLLQRIIIFLRKNKTEKLMYLIGIASAIMR